MRAMRLVLACLISVLLLCALPTTGGAQGPPVCLTAVAFGRHTPHRWWDWLAPSPAMCDHHYIGHARRGKP